MKKWIKRIALGIITIVLLFLIIAFTYEQVSRVIANGKNSPEGAFIDVGGHRIHFLRKGSGGPTVVFESGLDTSGHLPWYKVETEVSRFSTTVSYDRAGVLWSDRGNHLKTAEAMSEDLAALLENGEFPKPYILVGHSLAGITLRPFIIKNADDIAGIVLVDASHPDQMNRLPAEVNQRQAKWLVNIARSFGVLRFMTPSTFANTDAEDRINTVGMPLMHKSIGSFDEFENFELLANEVIQISSFGNIPVVVITGASPTRNNTAPEELREDITRVWSALQADQLNLSTDSQQILATESGHYVQLDEPEIVIRAIRDLITKVDSN